ncbi:MAG: hypothetical protein FJW23_09805 [Acidimicrobiia bacterium]|nr:hypothetical protein [Acidimicrobiia bacterium]
MKAPMAAFLVLLGGADASAQGTAPGAVTRLDPALDAIVEFGDADGRSLYTTGGRALYRVRLNASGW